MSCPHGYADGAYVLGALSPAERAEFEQHLAGCASCAVAVGQLAPLPGLLGRVDPAVLVQDQPDPARLPRLIEASSAQRRRQVRGDRRRLAAVALAAALAAAAGTAVWTGSASDDQPPPVASSPPAPAEPRAADEMLPTAVTSPVVAQVSVDESVGGSTVWMRCRYPHAGYHEPPRTFRLVAVGSDGSIEQVGSWRAGPGQQVELTGLTRFGADLERLELQDADGVTLLVHER